MLGGVVVDIEVVNIRLLDGSVVRDVFRCHPHGQGFRFVLPPPNEPDSLIFITAPSDEAAIAKIVEAIEDGRLERWPPKS